MTLSTKCCYAIDSKTEKAFQKYYSHKLYPVKTKVKILKFTDLPKWVQEVFTQ